MPVAIMACLRVQGTMSSVRHGPVMVRHPLTDRALYNHSTQRPSVVTLGGTLGGVHWNVSARFLGQLVHDNPWFDLNEVLSQYIVEPDLGGD